MRVIIHKSFFFILHFSMKFCPVLAEGWSCILGCTQCFHCQCKMCSVQVCQHTNGDSTTHLSAARFVYIFQYDSALCEKITCYRQHSALQSHQSCWLVCFPVSSILEAIRGDGGPAPGSHPDAHTPARESDTHPAAVPHRDCEAGPLCSPV